MANVFEALEGEWRRLGRDRAAAARVPEVCARAGRARTLHEVEAYVRQASPPEADQVLLDLATRVVSGPPAADEESAAEATCPVHPPVPLLAARVVLQLLLPGTRRLARRWWALGDRDERAAAAVAAVYHHIRAYPLARRPGRVAANILMDAAYDLRRTVPRVITVAVEDPGLLRRRDTAVEARDPNPAEELAEVLTEALAAGTIVPADAELIARSRIAGHSIDDIARERDRTPRTMWHRRQHAEAALAAAFKPTC